MNFTVLPLLTGLRRLQPLSKLTHQRGLVGTPAPQQGLTKLFERKAGQGFAFRPVAILSPRRVFRRTYASPRAVAIEPIAANSVFLK